jgi:hypothetical protein
MRLFQAFLIGLSAAVLCLGASPTTNANSGVGGPGQIVTLRHDIPILLAARLSSSRNIPTIRWVVSDGSRAVAVWEADHIGGLFAMALRLGK